MGIARRLPRITCEPRWLHRESCWEMTASWSIRALDLPRPEDQLLLGEVGTTSVPVVRRVGAGGQPGDHVVAAELA